MGFLDDVIVPMRKKVAGQGYGSLSEAERTIFCVAELETEVDKGGFHQYFSDSAGDRVLDAIDALRRIGAMQTSRIVEKACMLFPQGRPDPDRSKRQQQLDTFELDFEAFEALDSAFHAHREDLEKLQAKYWGSKQS